MSRLSSLPTMPSLSVTTDTRVIEQLDMMNNLEAKFLVKCNPDQGIITLLNFKLGHVIQSDLTYDTAYALYMALSDALDTLEEDMIINTEIVAN